MTTIIYYHYCWETCKKMNCWIPFMVGENAFHKDECHRTFIFTSGHAHWMGANKIFIFCCPPFLGGNGLSWRAIKHHYAKKLWDKGSQLTSGVSVYVALLCPMCLLTSQVPKKWWARACWSRRGHWANEDPLSWLPGIFQCNYRKNIPWELLVALPFPFKVKF